MAVICRQSIIYSFDDRLEVIVNKEKKEINYAKKNLVLSNSEIEKIKYTSITANNQYSQLCTANQHLRSIKKNASIESTLRIDRMI